MITLGRATFSLLKKFFIPPPTPPPPSPLPLPGLFSLVWQGQGKEQLSGYFSPWKIIRKVLKD